MAAISSTTLSLPFWHLREANFDGHALPRCTQLLREVVGVLLGPSGRDEQRRDVRLAPRGDL